MSIKIEMNNAVITLNSVAEAVELLNSLNVNTTNTNHINNNYNYIITESNAISKVKNNNTITLIYDIRNDKCYYCCNSDNIIVIDRSEYKNLLYDFSKNSGYVNTYYTNDIPDNIATHESL